MGARQSKRVEISGTSKKGDVENGAIVATEEKLEKIEEGESVASKTNHNGLTVTAEQQQQETTTSNAEVVAAVPETTPSKEVDIKNESVTEVAASPEKPTDAEATSPTSPAAAAAAEDSSKEQEAAVSPSEATTTEEGASSTNEKKKKQKKLKKWSFRSFSFSKKDKQKPVASKEEPKQQEALPEGNEAVSQAEQQNDDDAQKTKKAEEEEKKKKDDQVPPPLPTSPPPTPAEEIAVVATSVTSVSAPAAVPVKEESQIVSEGDVEASGGGEALAEPLEEGELEESSTTVTTTSTTTTVETSSTTTTTSVNGLLTTMTNGTNGIVESNGEVENGDLPSPVCELKVPIDVESVTAKIDSLKLQIATDNVESQSHAQNGFEDHSVNGDCSGADLNGSSDCHVATDSVVSVVSDPSAN